MLFENARNNNNEEPSTDDTGTGGEILRLPPPTNTPIYEYGKGAIVIAEDSIAIEPDRWESLKEALERFPHASREILNHFGGDDEQASSFGRYTPYAIWPRANDLPPGSHPDSIEAFVLSDEFMNAIAPFLGDGEFEVAAISVNILGPGDHLNEHTHSNAKHVRNVVLYPDVQYSGGVYGDYADGDTEPLEKPVTSRSVLIGGTERHFVTPVEEYPDGELRRTLVVFLRERSTGLLAAS